MSQAPRNISDKVESLRELLESITDEVACLEADWMDDSFTQDEKPQVSKDLVSIEKHLRETAKLFTHLTGNNYPDWGNYKGRMKENMSQFIMNIEEAQERLEAALEGMVQDRLFAGDDYAEVQELLIAWATIKEVIKRKGGK